MRITLASMIFLAGLSPAAQADDIFAGGPIPGSPTATCLFYNAGNTAVTIRNPRIVNLIGTPQTLSSNGCAATETLAPRQGCGIEDDSTDGVGLYVCRAVISPSAAKVRGFFITRAENGDFIASVELR